MQINVGIFFDSDQDGGGGFYQSLSVATALSKIDNKKFNMHRSKKYKGIKFFRCKNNIFSIKKNL